MPTTAPAAPYRAKTLAAWLALLFGAIGLHRIYLHGPRDLLAWAHLPVTVLGLVGVERMATLGHDDRLAWVLVPLLGLMLSQGMLFAILYALTPDERWGATWNPGQPARESRWGAVFAAVLGLLLGGIVLIGTIAFSIQKAFEWQAETPAEDVRR
ncbi:MAG: TM2 domain-containing protein [Rubrivivax sp.]|nr:TM2 domain-containing protein [Rubrivivax sp.]